MATFNDSHKEERNNNKYFDEGIHEVQVIGLTFSETTDNREYCDIIVSDGEREATSRFWFHTDGAMGYSFGAIRNMFVHNAAKNDKERVREKFNKIKDTKELESAMNLALVKDKAQVWLQVYQDGTYPASDGTQKPNYRREIYGYEPQEKKGKANHPQTGTVEPMTVTDENGEQQTIANF